MLLHRYHDMDYIMGLDVNTGLDLFVKAAEKERDERIFAQWVAQLPVMAISDKAVSFAEYREKLTGENIDRRSVHDIMAELDEVERKFKREGAS